MWLFWTEIRLVTVSSVSPPSIKCLEAVNHQRRNQVIQASNTTKAATYQTINSYRGMWFRTSHPRISFLVSRTATDWTSSSRTASSTSSKLYLYPVEMLNLEKMLSSHQVDFNQQLINLWVLLRDSWKTFLVTTLKKGKASLLTNLRKN